MEATISKYSHSVNPHSFPSFRELSSTGALFASGCSGEHFPHIRCWSISQECKLCA